jgi:hypothetical protein
MADEQNLTGQQIDQALRVVADCCARAEPPAGSSVTLWEWADQTRQAVNILGAVAATLLKRAAAEAEQAAPEMTLEMTEPVGVNGDQ